MGVEPTIEQMIYDLKYGTTNQKIKNPKLQLEVDELYHRFRVQKALGPVSNERVRQIYKEYMR